MFETKFGKEMKLMFCHQHTPSEIVHIFFWGGGEKMKQDRTNA
jgi:hypothetical protein